MPASESARPFEARVQPDFVAVLGDHASRFIDEAEAAAYGVWLDGRLAYVNLGWFGFARDNGGEAALDVWQLGRNLWDAVPTPLREFYQAGFEQSVSTGQPWSHTYECSSPELLRHFRMVVYPLGYGQGMLVVNSLLQEVAHPPGPSAVHLGDYTDDDGLIKQCMHCRRVQRCADGRWDWIPELVAAYRQNMSGSLCATCLVHHYPGATPRAP